MLQIYSSLKAGFCSLLLCLFAVFVVTFSAQTSAQTEADNLNAAQDKLMEEVWSNDERLEYHADSLVALGILSVALISAWLLNHASPQFRVGGTLLSAAACLGAAFTLIWLESIGAIENVRPPLFPPDNLKPTVLAVQKWTFLVAGLFLLFVGYRQTKRQDVLVLGQNNEVKRFGRRSRMLHWVTAMLIIALIPMGVFMTLIPEDVWYRQAYYVVHKSIGFTVLILLASRLTWHRISTKPVPDHHLKRWERIAAKSAHILLYLLMIGLPLSGFLLSTFAGKLSHFYLWDLPPMGTPDRDVLIPFAIAHKILLPALFYLVFVAHIAGVLKHRYLDKNEASTRRMVG